VHGVDVKWRGMVRRAAMVASSLALATSFGLTGAGMASAAAPALKIKPGAIWTLEMRHGACEHDIFDLIFHQFTSDRYGDGGVWSSGGSTINMIWTVGASSGVTFSGDFVSTTTPVEYKGSLNDGGAIIKTKVVKGAVSNFDGFTC
jgi:hypothetical protein